MSVIPLPVQNRRFGETSRKDRWWLYPAVVGVVLSTFLIYATWAAFQGRYYAFGNYLSPLYSPELFGESHHAWFGPKPGWWPVWLPFSPALLILWAPGLFRVTCYYYRGAYYKSFFLSPANCSVGEMKRKYSGERSFPLIMQNIHRYFMYIAVLFLFILTYDVWKAFWFENPVTGREEFGLGVGTLVLAMNTFLLGGYTLGCHSLRHAIGGIKDIMSGSKTRSTLYKCATCVNRKHMMFAWLSLLWVGFTDLYIRMLAMGNWTDIRIF